MARCEYPNIEASVTLGLQRSLTEGLQLARTLRVFMHNSRAEPKVTARRGFRDGRPVTLQRWRSAKLLDLGSKAALFDSSLSEQRGHLAVTPRCNRFSCARRTRSIEKTGCKRSDQAYTRLPPGWQMEILAEPLSFARADLPARSLISGSSSHLGQFRTFPLGLRPNKETAVCAITLNWGDPS
jgi:hypothetical protein